MAATGAEVRRDGAGHIVFALGSSLVNALVGAAPVVMVLVLGQDGLQVRRAEDQYPVQEFGAHRLVLAAPSWVRYSQEGGDWLRTGRDAAILAL